jgi:beta-N-acetylhexosaminidase
MTTSLRRAAGSLLVVGLSGAELTNLERAWLKLIRPAGIILFRRNIQDAKQTRTLLAEATALCAPHSFRCVDVEGGTVDRLRDALAPMPSAQAVMHAAMMTGKAALIREQGELVAQGVKAFGFNTTLAPVLDLALAESAAVMGTRVTASTSAGVVEYARHFLAGLAARGVVGCGKHFPGLGAGTLDSHLETPSIRSSWSQLWRQDLAPYRELRDQLPMIMVSHAAYPGTPGKHRPASVSAFWINTVLRKHIGYRGIIFSDDFEMGGILKFLSMEEAAVATIRAGMDLVEICHSPDLIMRAYDALIVEAERSIPFRDLLIVKTRRVARQRAALLPGELPKALSLRQFEALRAKVLRLSEEVNSTHTASEEPHA